MTDSNADALELTLDERKMEDLEVQSEAEEVPVAISPTGATRDILPQRPAVKNLVDRKKKKPVKPVKCKGVCSQANAGSD